MENMDEMMLSISGMGGAVIAHDAVDSQEGNLEEEEDDLNQQASFPCSMCPEGFDKKLLLNNHLKIKHGVNYVFTERGRKVKLVRLPEDGMTPARNPGTSSNVEQHIFIEPQGDEDDDEDDDVDIDLENAEGLGCGYAVQLDTVAYQKALVRKEVPFVAYFPLMSDNVYLLKVKEYGGKNQLLEPASKNDVINAFVKHSKNGCVKTTGDLLPIVAFVHQAYNNATGTTDITITAPLNINLSLKVVSQDKFTNLAFANPNSDPAEGGRGHVDEVDDEEPIPTRIKAKGKPRARRQRSRSKSKPKEKSTTPPQPPPKPVTPIVAVAQSETMLPPTPPTTSTLESAPPPPKKPKLSRRPKTTRAPKKIKAEPMEQDTEEKRSSQEVEVGMQQEEIGRQPPGTPTSEKEPGAGQEQVEVDDDAEEGKKFVRTPTCAPKKPPATAGPRRRGRPRKLKFEECLDEDAKMDTGEV